MRCASLSRVLVRRNSTAVQKCLQNELLHYFSLQEFKFERESHLPFLRAQMEMVYLRQTPLVAVDVEAYERSLNKITEIGVAIYDPRGQYLLAAPDIQSVHIIIKEHKKLLNKSFVPNNKYVFNGGTSYEMSQGELKAFLSQLFEYHFTERKSVLVGHNVSGDVKWLKKHGINNSDSLPTVDTQKLFQLSRRRGATLRGILRHINILHANLHNAANDAYYTLLAAMKYCDPAQRRAYGLDTYDALEHLLKQSKAEKAAATSLAKLQKFSDRSSVISKVPDIQDFVRTQVDVLGEVKEQNGQCIIK